MSEVIIRKAHIEDLSTLREFEQGVILAERPYDETLANDPISYYDLEGLIQAEDAEVLVAIRGDEIVGSGYAKILEAKLYHNCLLYTSPSPRDATLSRMPSSA